MRSVAAVACIVGLAGCPTVELGDTPSDIGLCNPAKGPAYFISDIEPTYLRLQDPVNGCARGGCHDGSVQGPRFDTTAPLDDMANYRDAQNFLNCGVPATSQLLTKPLAGIDGHRGGDIFADTSDPRVVDFLAWFR